MLPHRRIATADTNLATVKANGGTIGSIIAINKTAGILYLKIYDKASNPVLASNTPVLTLPIPASTSGAGFVLNGMNLQFGIGIAYAITGGSGDTDTTALAAGDVIINMIYE